MSAKHLMVRKLLLVILYTVLCICIIR